MTTFDIYLEFCKPVELYRVYVGDWPEQIPRDVTVNVCGLLDEQIVDDVVDE